MSDNASRKNLVTNFQCSVCGSDLCLSYEGKKIDFAGDHSITGAFKVDVFVYVEPCAKCLEPLERMRSAALTLLGN